MKKFESYDEALSDALDFDEDLRELEDGESYADLTVGEQKNIIDIHTCGGGMWTWCYQRDLKEW